MPDKLLADRMGTTIEALAGRKASEAGLPASSVEKWVAELKQCRNTRTSVTEKYFFKHAGRDAWYEYSLSYIEGSGNLFFCVAVDVTERRQADEALRESEEKFRVLADSSKTGILLSQDEEVVYINQALADMGGFTADECLHRKYWEVAPPESRELLRMRGSQRLRGETGPAGNELKLTHRDGREMWLEGTAAALMYRGRPAMMMTIADITERKRADEALQESEEKYRLLAETAPDMIYIVDNDFRVKYVNRAAADALGETPENLPGKSLEALFPEESAREMKEGLQRVMDSGKLLTDEMVNYFPGRAIPMHVILTPFCDREGKTIGVMGISRDISDRKKAEAALRDAKAQAELYLDLLGHDINNMHQIALGYLELARAKHPETLNREYLDKPIEVLYRSARLIKNVRKLQKLRNDALGSGIVDLTGVLTDVQREYGETAGKVVTLDLNGNERCQVRANELLYDVFANLVSNAVNHTGDGTSIAIVLEMIEESGCRYYRVSVEDDGPGIPDDIKGRIFDRMLKGTSRAKGMGLGLYLVKSLVESYGGRARVEDRVPGDYSKGARFVVILPEAGP